MLDIVRFIQRKRNTSKYAFVCQFCDIFGTGKSPVVIISTVKVRFLTLFQAKLTISSPKAHHAICENEQAVDAGYR